MKDTEYKNWLLNAVTISKPTPMQALSAHVAFDMDLGDLKFIDYAREEFASLGRGLAAALEEKLTKYAKEQNK